MEIISRGFIHGRMRKPDYRALQNIMFDTEQTIFQLPVSIQKQ